MSIVQQSVFFSASPARVFEALTTSEGHSAFTGAEAVISAEEGGAWSAYGGGIAGRTIESVPSERLVQAWRAGNWEAGVYSMVRIGLAAEGGGTRLTLEHTGLPTGTESHIAEGWRARYWEPLAAYLG
jgi:uncharacterized protein YndB with AHSA1/START domain